MFMLKQKLSTKVQKGDYPYEYVDDWKKFNETLFPEKIFK